MGVLALLFGGLTILAVGIFLGVVLCDWLGDWLLGDSDFPEEPDVDAVALYRELLERRGSAKPMTGDVIETPGVLTPQGRALVERFHAERTRARAPEEAMG